MLSGTSWGSQVCSSPDLLAEGPQQDACLAHVTSREHVGLKGLEATQPQMQLLKEFS